MGWAHHMMGSHQQKVEFRIITTKRVEFNKYAWNPSLGPIWLGTPKKVVAQLTQETWIKIRHADGTQKSRDLIFMNS